VTPLVPGATESQEFESPEVREKVGVKVAAGVVLLVLVALEVEDAVVVEDETAAVEDEVAVVEDETEVVEALPERVPETTLLPELEGEPREDLSQHVPEPMPPAPPTYVNALHLESASQAVIQSL
jgi:hypothetical protein